MSDWRQLTIDKVVAIHFSRLLWRVLVWDSLKEPQHHWHARDEVTGRSSDRNSLALKAKFQRQCPSCLYRSHCEQCQHEITAKGHHKVAGHNSAVRASQAQRGNAMSGQQGARPCASVVDGASCLCWTTASVSWAFGARVHLAAAFWRCLCICSPICVHLAAAVLALQVHVGKRIKQGILDLVLTLFLAGQLCSDPTRQSAAACSSSAFT